MANVLIIRLSAIGDVAMTIPVVYSAAKSNPEHVFTVLTQPFLTQLFINAPENVRLLGIDTKKSEKTIAGLLRYAINLSRQNYDLVLDLHDVIRTKIIRSFFKWKKKPVYVLDKARKAREKLTRQEEKELTPLTPVIDRYAQVFKDAGFLYAEAFTSLFLPREFPVSEWKKEDEKEWWIGIAPFAKHRGKIYPVKAMEEVVRILSQKYNCHIFLFGGKGKEEEILSRWESRYPNVKNLVGLYTLDKELELIAGLDLLISMDSANMHFASLVGTKVLSIWGATHPYAGFYGYHQNPEYALQLDMTCRPCSVFGEKECFRGDWACMTQIMPMDIVHKVCGILG